LFGDVVIIELADKSEWRKKFKKIEEDDENDENDTKQLATR
jgi:hypothetical protein